MISFTHKSTWEPHFELSCGTFDVKKSPYEDWWTVMVSADSKSCASDSRLIIIYQWWTGIKISEDWITNVRSVSLGAILNYYILH